MRTKAAKPVLFLDANQYLDLYRMPRWRQALTMLAEHKDYVFVTQQIVDEVQRRKVGVAAAFFADLLKKMELTAMAVPDQLFSSTDSRLQRLGQHLQETRREIIEATQEFRKLTPEFVQQVSQSTDEVSQALKAIFCLAVAPSERELECAKERKMRGNPPGKSSDPLGDQLTWEQLLTRCKDKSQVWILTRDSDYTTKHELKVFLNALLHQELAALYKGDPEVFCFDTIGAGIENFSTSAAVKAAKLLTPDETEQIKKEQESLPPIGWLSNPAEALSVAIQKAQINTPFLSAALAAELNAQQAALSSLPTLASRLNTDQLFANDLARLAIEFDQAPLRQMAEMSKAATEAMRKVSAHFDISQVHKALANLSTEAILGTAKMAEAFASLNAKQVSFTSEVMTALASGGAHSSESQAKKSPSEQDENGSGSHPDRGERS